MSEPTHQFKRAWGPYLVTYVLTSIVSCLEFPDGSIVDWILSYPGMAFLDFAVSYCLYRYLFSKDKERLWLLYLICIYKFLALNYRFLLSL